MLSHRRSSEALMVEGNNNPPKTLIIIMRSISHLIQPQRLFERTLNNVIPLLASGGAALGFAQGEEDETEGKLKIPDLRDASMRRCCPM